MKVREFKSAEENVSKFVYEFEDAISEAVLYKYESYEKRTVICCSVQSGCPVGCIFCGTGKQFIRNLTSDEICAQVNHIADKIYEETGIEVNDDCDKFQIMFMSMGEPFLNMKNVIEAIDTINLKYKRAQLLVSTSGINNTVAWDDFLFMSENNRKVGLQFSLHSGFELMRNEIIPYQNKMSLKAIRNTGIEWYKTTNSPVYLNYCVNERNAQLNELEEITKLFPPNVFYFTFSVICSSDETLKDAGYRNIEKIKKVMDYFNKEGYNTRMFDPAGQDDIGGGCGQLWYTQKYLKENVK